MPDFEAERRIEADQVRERLREIEATIYAQRQPIGALEACVTGRGHGPEQPPEKGWKPFRVHDRWGGFDQTTWFRVKVEVPASMRGQRVVALIHPGGESLAYVNDTPTQGLDNNRDEIYLVEKAKGGERFNIVLESVPSVRFDEHHYFTHADIAVMRPLVWEFYWDVSVAFDVWKELPDSAPRRRLLEVVKQALLRVDLQHTNEPAYFASIQKAQQYLRKELKRFPSGDGSGALAVSGQSHIDTAWLWPLRETKRKCGRTFSTVLSLLDRYPDFIFTCSQPVQYEWMKENYPQQFARIRDYVKEGRWEPCGAMYVEADCNVPSGESLVRQVMFGTRFYEREFGRRSRMAWLPDAFGYAWSMPQILRKAGVDTIYTIKVTWSQFTKFPYSLFEWEGIDGTRVLALVPPLNYNGMMTVHDAIEQWERFKQKERVEEVIYPVGWGDGGGGPTMKMIETARRLGDVIGVPRCSFSGMQDAADRTREHTRGQTLPVWNDEMYLELHRACQTTQARTKRNNRKCELLLRDAEFLGAFAMAQGGEYRQAQLEQAWKLVLVNQFHDILPGSSITEVYSDTDGDYARARELTEPVRDGALAHLASRIDTHGNGRPIVVFNTLGWRRDDIVELKLEKSSNGCAVIDPDGNPVPCQRAGNMLLFEARDLPALGYATYRLVPDEKKQPKVGMLKAAAGVMENDFLRIKIDKHGRLTSLYDKQERREILPGKQKANVFQLFDDRPRGNDAWDFDFNFEDTMWEPGSAESLEVVESGPVRAVIRVVRKTERSTITQDITMYALLPRVDFVTRVDWHEKRVLMKVAFPVDVRAQRATYEIQYGAIERATHHNTDYDRARFEVPAQKWADLSEGNYGVSLLNDCKYGYDIRENVMRLSLLRAPVDPDPTADEGEHHFVYSIYPHQWGWRNGTVQQAAQLNSPAVAVVADAHEGPMEPTDSFVQSSVDNVIVDTVKKAEDSDALIVRVYEAYGQRGEVVLAFGRPIKKAAECDLLEENDSPVDSGKSSIRFFVKPFEIRTFKVRL